MVMLMIMIMFGCPDYDLVPHSRHHPRPRPSAWAGMTSSPTPEGQSGKGSFHDEGRWYDGNGRMVVKITMIHGIRYDLVPYSRHNGPPPEARPSA
jgi:hypothetical protein